MKYNPILHFIYGYDRETEQYGIINISAWEFWLWRITAIVFWIFLLTK